MTSLGVRIRAATSRTFGKGERARKYSQTGNICEERSEGVLGMSSWSSCRGQDMVVYICTPHSYDSDHQVHPHERFFCI